MLYEKSRKKPGLYGGNIGRVTMRFIFYEMCPSASWYGDVPWLHRHSENET